MVALSATAQARLRALRMTVAASTKRPPALSGGVRGVAVTHLATLAVAPLQPLDRSTSAEVTQLREALQSGYVLLETWCAAAEDVKIGDTLVVSGVEYPIRLRSVWGQHAHLVVEGKNE